MSCCKRGLVCHWKEYGSRYKPRQNRGWSSTMDCSSLCFSFYRPKRYAALGALFSAKASPTKKQNDSAQNFSFDIRKIWQHYLVFHNSLCCKIWRVSVGFMICERMPSTWTISAAKMRKAAFPLVLNASVTWSRKRSASAPNKDSLPPSGKSSAAVTSCLSRSRRIYGLTCTSWKRNYEKFCEAGRNAVKRKYWRQIVYIHQSVHNEID